MCTPRSLLSLLTLPLRRCRGTNNQKFCGFNWIWAMPQNREGEKPGGGGCWQLEKVEFAFEQSWGNKINCNQVKRHSTRHEGQPERRLDLKPDCKLNWERGIQLEARTGNGNGAANGGHRFPLLGPRLTLWAVNLLNCQHSTHFSFFLCTKRSAANRLDWFALMNLCKSFN